MKFTRPDSCHSCVSLGLLSDEAAVEILDFLQMFMPDFENRYATQLRRYYDQRSRHSMVQVEESVGNDDPPF